MWTSLNMFCELWLLHETIVMLPLLSIEVSMLMSPNYDHNIHLSSLITMFFWNVVASMILMSIEVWLWSCHFEKYCFYEYDDHSLWSQYVGSIWVDLLSPRHDIMTFLFNGPSLYAYSHAPFILQSTWMCSLFIYAFLTLKTVDIKL